VTDIHDDLVVHFPIIRFNPLYVAEDVALTDANRRVSKATGSEDGWKCIDLKNGISSGCKFWSFRIINRGSSANIMIGVLDSTIDVTKITYPGHADGTGCSIYLLNGSFYCNGTQTAVSMDVSRVQKATVIGVLLNMSHKTVTFYADGDGVGTVDARVLKGHEWFPVVSLFRQGQCVEVMDLPRALVWK
jgi:SPRY domain